MAAVSDDRLKSVLFIESGPRDAGERAIARIYECAAGRLDVLTCFRESPKQFDPSRGSLLSVHSTEARANRGAFVRSLCSRPYTAIVILCVGSGVLRLWALAIGARTLGRVLLLDGELDELTLHRSLRRAIGQAIWRQLAPVRNVDLHWDRLDSALIRGWELLLAPFQLGYLALFTLKTHLARRLRVALKKVPES